MHIPSFSETARLSASPASHVKAGLLSREFKREKFRLEGETTSIKDGNVAHGSRMCQVRSARDAHEPDQILQLKSIVDNVAIAAVALLSTVARVSEGAEYVPAVQSKNEGDVNIKYRRRRPREHFPLRLHLRQHVSQPIPWREPAGGSFRSSLRAYGTEIQWKYRQIGMRTGS